MKRVWVAILPALFFSTLSAQSYQPVASKSQVKVIIKNVGMDTEGRLSGLQGNIIFNPADLKAALFDMSVDASSINTEIEPRDKALREAEFLNTAVYPRISFRSKQVTQAGINRFQLKGTVTIKGSSKEISFPFIVAPADDGILFTGEMKLNRRDFSIANGSVVLSESFTVALRVFARRS